MTSTIQHHPIFYFYNSSIILQAENTLYNVYQQTLGIKSLFFASMLSLPFAAEPSGTQKEEMVSSSFMAHQEHACMAGLDGGSDSTALQLSHTVAKVDKFFMFIFNEAEWTLELPKLQGLCSLLKLSTFYLVDLGRKNMIHHLSNHPELQPALQLHLVCTYNIKE